jgi:hypothetical protein
VEGTILIGNGILVQPNHNRAEPAISSASVPAGDLPARRNTGIRIKISTSRLKSFPGRRTHRLRAQHDDEDHPELGEVKPAKAERT